MLTMEDDFWMVLHRTLCILPLQQTEAAFIEMFNCFLRLQRLLSVVCGTTRVHSLTKTIEHVYKMSVPEFMTEDKNGWLSRRRPRHDCKDS